MNKQKLISICAVVALAAVAVVGGTLAYFTDTEQKTNVMTVGNVEINLDEFQKVDGKWEPFENEDFTLYPVASSEGVLYRNKIAYTANVSPSKDDAYIRTIVLFEANSKLEGSDYKPQADCCVPGLHFNYFAEAEAKSVINGKTIHGAKTTNLGQMTVDGKQYEVVLFEEVSGKAVPYDEALFSLNGVFMDKNIDNDLIKGWGEDGVDIIAFSQAIQAEGLTYEQAMKELGVINGTNLTEWIGTDDAYVNDWAAIL